MLKPQFFEYLKKEKEAWDAVRDVQSWMVRRTNIQVRILFYLQRQLVDFRARTMVYTGDVDGMLRR